MIRDTNKGEEIYYQYSYTYEYKLTTIDIVITTQDYYPYNSLKRVSRYYITKRLKILRTILTHWIKSKYRILTLKRGSQYLQLSKVSYYPELKKKLNIDFEKARLIRRNITYYQFLQSVSYSFDNFN